eukprot:scaffold52343_cov21-Tisochrysis_lutea.AAC.1
MIPAAKGSYSFASKAGVHAGHTFVLRPPPCTNRRVDCRSFSRDSDVPAGPATPYQDANVQQWGLPWDYKYTRVSCSSPCSFDDMRCLK